jgi:4-carboxymuconolactone decarboxylase
MPNAERAFLPPTASQLSERAHEVEEYLTKTRGSVPNIFKVGLHSPELLGRLVGVGGYLRFESILDDRLRELVILSVADETGCAYERAHHAPIARALGVSDDEVQPAGLVALAEAQTLEGAALRFARNVARGSNVPAETFETVRSGLGEQGLVELSLLAGYYLLLSRWVGVLNVQFDPELNG